MSSQKGIRVTSNAGGVNPRGCAEAVLEVARRLGLTGKLRVGLVTGDDILGRLDELIARGHPLRDMETGRPLADVRDQVLSANAYLGMAPDRRGAARRGRCGGHRPGDRHRAHARTHLPRVRLVARGLGQGGGRDRRRTHHRVRRAGIGRQPAASGWRSVKGMENPGFPIVEASADGSFVVTKHPGTGGVVSVASVKEQLVYEMGDPVSYITPDGVADFTTIRLRRPAGTGCGSTASAGRRARRCSRFRSRTSTATRRSARWSTPGPKRTTRRAPPTGSFVGGSPTWVSSSSRS